MASSAMRARSGKKRGLPILAFVEDQVVRQFGWLTAQEFIDGLALGQLTPGPIITLAAFVGYRVAGVAGAVVSAVAIFLPSFVLVAVSYPLLPRIRGSRGMSAFLDGVNVAAVGLMAAVTWQLARAAIVDVFTAALAVVAGALLLRTRLNSAWLVLGGAAAGLLFRRVTAG